MTSETSQSYDSHLERLLFGGEGRSVRKALGFLAIGYLLNFALLTMVDLEVGNIGVYILLTYCILGLLLVSQVWFLSLKPVYENPNKTISSGKALAGLTLSYSLFAVIHFLISETLITRLVVMPLFSIIPIYAVLMFVSIRLLEKYSGDRSLLEYIFIGTEGRSVGRAFAFFFVGYSLATVLMILWTLGGIARGLGDADPAPFSPTLWFFVYSGAAVAIASQVWYLLIKPIYETSENYKSRIAAVLTPIVVASPFAVDYVLLLLGLSRGLMIPYIDIDSSLGEPFTFIGFPYLLILLAVTAWKYFKSRKSKRT